MAPSPLAVDPLQQEARGEERLRPEAHDNFVKGERYLKSPELVQKFIDCLPIADIPAATVVFKPLGDVDAKSDPPKVITFFADPDQLSAKKRRPIRLKIPAWKWSRTSTTLWPIPGKALSMRHPTKKATFTPFPSFRTSWW